jgi:hypothetical protein
MAYSGLLDNTGTIRGGGGLASKADYGGDGVIMSSGFASNSGMISGGAGFNAGDGVVMIDGTLVNSGTILGGNLSGVAGGVGGIGVDISGESVANTGSIGGGAGGIGVYLAGGTITNADTMSGGVGTGADYAIRSGSPPSTLIIDPGAVLNSLVLGNGVSDTLDLASAASVGTLSGLGTQYADFPTVAVSAGAAWVLLGSNSISGLAEISGTLVVAGGTLDLQSVADGLGDITIGAGATLVLQQLETVADITFAPGGPEQLQVDTTISPGSFLVGFGTGDTIDLGLAGSDPSVLPTAPLPSTICSATRSARSCSWAPTTPPISP